MLGPMLDELSLSWSGGDLSGELSVDELNGVGGCSLGYIPSQHKTISGFEMACLPKEQLGILTP